MIACGEGIKKNTMLESASIFDLTPSILSLLGIPVEEDFDGFLCQYYIYIEG